MKFEPVYHPVMQTPILYWMNEQSGVLYTALQAFLDASLGRGTITPEQFDMVKAYFEYIIDAPCWKANSPEALSSLRNRIREAETLELLTKWIDDCLDIGIDPI